VLAVAAAWSVNPDTLDQRDDVGAVGILGYRDLAETKSRA